MFVDLAPYTKERWSKILLAYTLSKETVTAIIMFYENTEAIVLSPDIDTNFFDIVAGVLQGDTFALFLFIIGYDYVLRKKITITETDYADNQVIHSNIHSQAESLLLMLEHAARGISLNVNPDNIPW